MGSEIQSDNTVVKAVIEGTAPRQARLAAARGILPLPQNDLLEALVALSKESDAELSTQARETLNAQQAQAVESAVRSDNIAPEVLAFFAAQPGISAAAQEAIITNANTPPAAIAQFARITRNGEMLELISFNQQLLIQTPAIIDAIIANPYRTAEALRRAVETKREFFEKERGAQQIANELRARGKEAAAEFIERAEFAVDIDSGGMSVDDAILLAEMIEVPDAETDDSWLSLEYLEDIYEESEEERAALVDKILGEMHMEGEGVGAEHVSMINRVMKMGMRDRMRLALKGDREARNILIRDPNRLVSVAVVQNPRITEQEIEKIAAMRSVPGEVLRGIATNRQWGRNYNVMHNLARNPRTPIANAMTILSRMQLRDLTALSRNRNVSDAVRRHALRLAQTRSGNR